MAPGGRLGLYGFGGSAHIVLQLAKDEGCRVYVVSRGERHQELARKLGEMALGMDRLRKRLNAG